MRWFCRKKEKEQRAVNLTAPIEIEPHQEARREVVEQTKKVNEHLKELLVENGFTIKIYLAAGGNTKNKKD